MKSYTYAESFTLPRKNQYSEKNPYRKKPVVRATTGREKPEHWSADTSFVARPRSTTRSRNFWEGYSAGVLDKRGESKAVYHVKRKPTKLDALGRKAKITRRQFYRFDPTEQINASNRYDILLCEYQRLVDLELNEEISVENGIKKEQIEAELDAIEAKQALETYGENSCQSDIDKLARLIELAKEIRTLT
jgi:hypothetical protein